MTPRKVNAGSATLGDIASCLQMMTTVEVSNVSLGATDRDLKEFVSFSGGILYPETLRFALCFTRKFRFKKRFFLTLKKKLVCSSSPLLFFLPRLYSEAERSKLAYVTFKDLQGAETAVLLSVCSVPLSLPLMFSSDWVFMSLITSGSNDCWSPEALASLVITSLFSSHLH